MWTMSEAMRQGLRREHQVATKVVLLDTEFRPVEGGVIYAGGVPADATVNELAAHARRHELTNFVVDGSIDVDTERATRRTSELTLVNPSAQFTPSTEDFRPEGPWVGLIYLNRLVRIHRGIFINGVPEYVPVGTFMIDRANVIAERNMSLVNLTMSDLWKKMAKSYTDRAYNFAKNSWYNDIIETLINDAGGYHPSLMPSIDPLNGRETEDKRINKILTIEDGTSRGDFLKDLVQTWDIDMYYDPMGRIKTEDRKSAADRRSVWHFYADRSVRGTGADEHTGMLISVNREFTDDNLYNHVIVVGGADKDIIRREKADTDPRSKTNIALIGDRVWRLEDDKLDTVAKVNKALDRAWAIRFQLGETIQCETISNPALEGDDVVRITDTRYAKVDATYRLRRFTVPLVSSRQDIQAANIIYEANL
jgi:hypothetical protein